MFEAWPFTNFHDLNLDWIIKTIKKLSAEVDKWAKYIDDFFNNGGIKETVEKVLTAHPEWTMADEVLPFVTPEMYGAVGDGVTNDAAAFLAAFNVCKNGDYYLKTFHKNYVTDGLVLDYAGTKFPMEILGNITELEIRGKSDASTTTNVYIEEADLVTLTNVQGIRLDISRCDHLILKGDNSVTSGNGGCAYNVVNGVKIDQVDLICYNTGWVNENIINRARITTLRVIGSTTHLADNNRFYDVVLESGSVDLQHAQSNYIRLRGERYPTVTEDIYSYNNTMVATWISTRMGYTVATETAPTTKYNEQSIPYRPHLMMHADALNANGNDQTHEITISPNTTLYVVHIKMDQNMFITFRANIATSNVSIKLYDSVGSNITTSSDNGIGATNKFNCPQVTYSSGNNDPYFRGAQLFDSIAIKAYKQTTETWMRLAFYTMGSTITPKCFDVYTYSGKTPLYYETTNITL